MYAKNRAKLVLVSIIISFFSLFLLSAEPVEHEVKKGDTLYSIARVYKIKVDELMKFNNINDPSKLHIGMKLLIPSVSSNPSSAGESPVSYTIKKGDTLYSIAKAHGVSVDAILAASSLGSSAIKVGQVIKIPETNVVKAKPETSIAKETKPEPAKKEATVAPSTKSVSSPTLVSYPVSQKINSKSWPVSGLVSSLQGKLQGVSIISDTASCGIQSLRAGTVISAGPFRGFDQVAFVQSVDGLVYVYGGAAVLSVKVGDSVRKGAVLGKSASNKAENPVYFFVFKGSDTIDPITAPRD